MPARENIDSISDDEIIVRIVFLEAGFDCAAEIAKNAIDKFKDTKGLMEATPEELSLITGMNVEKLLVLLEWQEKCSQIALVSDGFKPYDSKTLH